MEETLKLIMLKKEDNSNQKKQSKFAFFVIKILNYLYLY